MVGLAGTLALSFLLAPEPIPTIIAYGWRVVMVLWVVRWWRARKRRKARLEAILGRMRYLGHIDWRSGHSDSPAWWRR